MVLVLWTDIRQPTLDFNWWSSDMFPVDIKQDIIRIVWTEQTLTRTTNFYMYLCYGPTKIVQLWNAEVR
jgi:hypothetical protein